MSAFIPHQPPPVASLAEAWIETASRKVKPITSRVASLAEAWIETTIQRNERGF